MMRLLTLAQVVWLGVLRRKDLYVLLILLGSLLALLVSLNIFGLGSAAIYVTDIGLLATWLLGWILAVTVGARELPTEEERGTVFALLAKPITRLELLAAKWLGAWSIVWAATLVFYALVFLMTALRGGRISPATAAQGVILHGMALGVITAMAVAFSTRMNRDAATAITFVLSAASFFLTPRIPEFLVSETGAHHLGLAFLYHALPHFEIFDMRRRLSFNYGPLDAPAFMTIILYGLLLSLVFMALAWLAYRNKRFSRSALTL